MFKSHQKRAYELALITTDESFTDTDIIESANLHAKYPCCLARVG